MKIIITFLIVLTAFPLFANPYSDVSESEMIFIRNNFYAAVDSEDSLDVLKKFIDRNYPEEENYPVLILAYAGGVESLKAKYTPFPISKFLHVKKALNKLEMAVETAPDNLEIRFLRFAILNNIPAILGYGKERREDTERIVDLLIQKNYTHLDLDSQIDISNYMLDSDRLSEEQIFKLKNSFLALNE